jgi:phytoene dehydrogenase-like protein
MDTGRRRYDAIVIGGGHNGLVNAAYLAQSGMSTLVLEARDTLGGAAITEELYPGHQFTTFSYAISLLRPAVIADLDLVAHGLSIRPLTTSFAPTLDNGHLVIGPDGAANFHEISRHSRRDAEAYLEYSHLLERTCQAVKPFFDSIPPSPTSEDPDEIDRLRAARAEFAALAPEVREFLSRLLTESAADILDDYFESDILKGLLASSGIIGSRVGPRSAGSGLVLLYHNLGEVDGVFGTWGFHKGGNGGFIRVLESAAMANGVEIVCNAPVAAVRYSASAAGGVILADGTEYDASVVVSALDPRRTLLELVDPGDLPDDLVAAIEGYKFQGTSAKVNFALRGLPEHPAMPGRPDVFDGFINIAPSIDYLERAYADACEGRLSSEPYLDCCVQTRLDPEMAPPGHHVMSCFVQYAPYQLAAGDWDSERTILGDRVQQMLERYFPGFEGLVVHREVVTPLDIERVVGLSEGNIFAGELLWDQMYTSRPAPGWSQYRTPISGYYQCGSGTHPGGCITGGPGMLAARQILGDF